MDKPWTPGEREVVYDGPSRPMVRCGNWVLLSVSQYENGRWSPFDGEDRECSLLAQAPALVEALEELVRSTDAWPEPFDEGDWPELDNARAVLARVREGA